jgi:hypothetical protein
MLAGDRSAAVSVVVGPEVAVPPEPAPAVDGDPVTAPAPLAGTEFGPS